MDSFSDVIEELGGPASIGEGLSEDPAKIRMWKHRNAIPSSQWAAFVELAKSRGIAGITFELLGMLASEKRSDRSNPDEEAA